MPNDKNHRQCKIEINGRKIQVDGFDSETNTIYEYYGDFWHGNPNIYKSEEVNPINKKSYGVLYENTMKREKLIKNDGYNLITQWETNVY